MPGCLPRCLVQCPRKANCNPSRGSTGFATGWPSPLGAVASSRHTSAAGTSLVCAFWMLRHPSPSRAMSLLSVLSRWHQWRRAFTHERDYSRSSFSYPDDLDPDEELDALILQAVESEISRLPPDQQRIAQQIARAEWLGVDIDAQAASEAAEVIRILTRRLTAAGLI